jgi:predicted transcriptional regulator
MRSAEERKPGRIIGIAESFQTQASRHQFRLPQESEYSFIPVVEDDALLGYVDLQMVRKMDREHWATTKVEDVLESIGEQNTVPSKMASLDLISMMQKTGQHKFLVTEGRGLVGVITLSDMLALLRVFRETT